MILKQYYLGCLGVCLLPGRRRTQRQGRGARPAATGGDRRRAPAEFEQRRIEAAVHVPLSRLLERIGEVPTDRSVVVYCESGYRWAVAASLLGLHGRSEVSDLVGGF
jgi:hypothetical protein